jgi:isopenicillin-N epimerase
MAFTRRDWFARLPIGWTALAQTLRADAAGEEYWKMVARQFPLEPGLIYLNAANVCPASRPVMDRHLEFLRDFHANPSFQNREKYAGIEERVRAKLAALLHVTADEIALPRNTSEATNLIVRGIDLKAGDEAVITEHNHPSNNDSWKVRARRDGFSVRAIPVPVPAQSVPQLLEAIEAAITPRTRVLSVTHVTNTAGLKYPAAAIGQIARRKNVWFHLDGAQSFGAMDVDLRAIGCDSYAASMHKWPMGPLEAGLLYVRTDRQKEVWPSIVTAGWSDKLVGARKFEVFGQRDDPRLASIEAAADFLALIGLKRVETRVAELTSALKKRLSGNSSFVLRTNAEPELSHGVVKVGFRSGDLKSAYDRLYQKDRVAIAMTASGETSGLRFSPHVYNTLEEMDRVADLVERAAKG